ncbi:MAG: DUF7118 family protein [Halobacteriota archaeon]
MEPDELLAEIDAVNEQIREVGRARLELVEQFNQELRTLIRSFEETPDTFRVYVDLAKRLDRIARRVGKAHDEGLLDHTEHFDKALAVLKKRRFETATSELDRIPNLGLLARQRQLFDEYKKAYAAMRARRDAVGREIATKSEYYSSLQRVEVASFDEVASLEERMETYNDEVGSFLEAFFVHAPAAESLKISLDACYHPELGFPQPLRYDHAERLLVFLQRESLGSAPLHQLLEYATYSDNKLSHYVKDKIAFKQVMEANITWLEALDTIKHRAALKLSLAESGSSLSVRIPRMIAFLSKRGAPPDMITFCRDVQRLVRSGRYKRIRATTTVNRDHLEQMQRGTHVDDLASLREDHARLSEALAQLKEPRELELA